MKEEKNKNTHQSKDESPVSDANDSNNHIDSGTINQEETKVKNANAAGIGAMGRNDEKLTEYKSDNTGNAGDY